MPNESYPQIPDARRELTWTHVCSLLAVSDLKKRAQLEEKVRPEKLSTRQLDPAKQEG